MKRFAWLAVVVVSVVVADAAQAGVIRRGGGCPGGMCGVAAAPAPTMAAKAPAKETELAGDLTESTQPTVEAATSSQTRYARIRGFGRRR